MRDEQHTHPGHQHAPQAGTAAGSKSRPTILGSVSPCPAPPRQLEEVGGVVTYPPSGTVRCVNPQSHLIAQVQLKAKPAVRWLLTVTRVQA